MSALLLPGPTLADKRRRLVVAQLSEVWDVDFLPHCANALSTEGLEALYEMVTEARAAGPSERNPRALCAWEEREVRRIRPHTEEAFVYYFCNYASHQPADGGVREALTPWPFQVELAHRLIRHDATIIPKSRRVGVSMTTEHLVGWEAAHCEATPGARIICLSKDGTGAIEFAGRSRDILEAQPLYLRAVIGSAGRDKKGKEGKDQMQLYSFPERGGAFIQALTATPKTARGSTAYRLVMDEAAWMEKAQLVFNAADSAIEGSDKLTVISTGNGRTGMGAKFASLCEGAVDVDVLEAGEAELGDTKHVRIFIPATARPDRAEEFFKAKQSTRSPDEFRQEYPETLEDALAGETEGRLLSLSAIEAAVERGRKLKAEGLVISRTGKVETGTDFGGEYSSVTKVPLSSWGAFITAASSAGGTEEAPDDFCVRFMEKAAKAGPVERSFFDSAHRSEIITWKKLYRNQRIECRRVEFGGKARLKRDIVKYIQTLLARTLAGEAYGFIAFDPDDKETMLLVEQMKGLEKDREGMPNKKTPDHLFDALVSSLKDDALKWRKDNAAE